MERNCDHLVGKYVALKYDTQLSHDEKSVTGRVAFLQVLHWRHAFEVWEDLGLLLILYISRGRFDSDLDD